MSSAGATSTSAVPATPGGPSGPGGPAAPAPGALTHRQIMTIVTALLLGTFLAALDQTVVSTAIRSIGDDLHGLSAQAWVTTAFLITSTITTPLYGKLSDIYGRKPLFLIAISIFVVGSVLCGMASSMYVLAGFRALQGLGAGGLFSLAMSIMADIVSPQQRPKYMAYFMATFATSSVAGPVIGGFLAGQDSVAGLAGWRWIFWINVPIGLIALVVVNRVLRGGGKRGSTRIDWWGTVAIIAAVVPLLLVAERGRGWGWGSAVSVSCYVIGAIGLAGFVVAERYMGDDALIPLRLFGGRTFSVGTVLSIIVGIGMFGGLAVVPLYLQIIKGASPTEAGLLLLPMMAGVMIASMTSGRLIARTGRYRVYPLVGFSCMVAALGLLSFVGADTPLWRTELAMLLFGLGLGQTMQTLVVAMQNSVAPRDIGVATSSSTFFRQIGGTLGTAVFLSILFGAAPERITDAYQAAAGTTAFGAAAAAHPDQLRQVTASGSLDDSGFLQDIEKAIAHPFMVGFSDAMDLVFLVGAATVVIGVLIALFLPEVPLRTMSGLEAARADAAVADAATPAAPVTTPGSADVEIMIPEPAAGSPPETAADDAAVSATAPAPAGAPVEVETQDEAEGEAPDHPQTESQAQAGTAS
ncbi:MDR family MFS transporter [Parafrankia sp. EUN1f]|uniref:MDR family MFS transporter n=1 Tax=Parafrankia sp. EUN1f TaxID=102897 RepID=UPI0001C45FC5|nr:MDR family MFS transporter [Parafrankia sp. EUN1f]EFC81393.1 drug resistance transporter, EmrB/QacA subfamily [Parafrankia sp. EUN1f]